MTKTEICREVGHVAKKRKAEKRFNIDQSIMHLQEAKELSFIVRTWPKRRSSQLEPTLMIEWSNNQLERP